MLFFVLILTSSITFAQINLTANPNTVTLPNGNSAFLDASSAYDTDFNGSNNKGKGLVFPQVDLTTFEFDTTTPDGAEVLPTFYDGMIVYNSATGKTLEDATKGGIQVSVEPGFYYFYNPNGRTNQSVAQGKWLKLGSGNESANTQYLTPEYVGATGVWMQNVATSGNTIKFKVTNHASANFSSLNFQNALRLNGASQGLSYTAAEDYTNVALAGGQSKTLTYNVTGTPLSYGVLTANFSALNGAITAYGTIPVQEQSAVKVLSVELLGDYISNKTVTNAEKVQVKIHNFSTQAVSNTDLSRVINLSGVAGLSVAPSQNTSVSIPVGGEVTLTYALQGAPTSVGNLIAAFNPNAVVSGNANTTKAVNAFTNVSVSNMQIGGDYVVNQAMTASNQVQVTLHNNNAFELVHLNAQDALTLSGSYQAMTVQANQNTDFNLPANGTKVLSYTLTGEPHVGGPMTATWSQSPFGSVSANKTVAQFNVSPTTFYFSANQNGSGTITINSSEPWQYELLPGASWISVGTATGQNGNGTLSFTTQPHTSATAELGFIRIYRNDGNGVKVAIRQPPTDDFNVATNGYFSIHGETKDFTVSYGGSSNWSVVSYPDWVESATQVNATTLRVVSKPRTEVGDLKEGIIRLTYGGGYLKECWIAQKQKAEKCPATPPAGLRADKGYRIWHYKEEPTFEEFLTLYEERDGNDDFSDVGVGAYIQTQVVKTATKSYLYVGTSASIRTSVYYNTYWSGYKQSDYYLTSTDSSQELSKYLNNQLPKYPRVTPLICVDGYDEDTPSRP